MWGKLRKIWPKPINNRLWNKSQNKFNIVPLQVARLTRVMPCFGRRPNRRLSTLKICKWTIMSSLKRRLLGTSPAPWVTTTTEVINRGLELRRMHSLQRIRGQRGMTSLSPNYSQDYFQVRTRIRKRLQAHSNQSIICTRFNSGGSLRSCCKIIKHRNQKTCSIVDAKL